MSTRCRLAVALCDHVAINDVELMTWMQDMGEWWINPVVSDRRPNDPSWLIFGLAMRHCKKLKKQPVIHPASR